VSFQRAGQSSSPSIVAFAAATLAASRRAAAAVSCQAASGSAARSASASSSRRRRQRTAPRAATSAVRHAAPNSAPSPKKTPGASTASRVGGRPEPGGSTVTARIAIAACPRPPQRQQARLATLSSAAVGSAVPTEVVKVTGLLRAMAVTVKPATIEAASAAAMPMPAASGPSGPKAIAQCASDCAVTMRPAP
jgi:hypothetical protein